MPKLNPRRTAAVYAVGDHTAHAAYREMLSAHHLTAIDGRAERPAALDLSVVQRPILRLCLLQVKLQSAEVFVTDSFANLGDATERAAIVGACIQSGADVIVGTERIDGGWYQARVRKIGFQDVFPIIDQLLSTATLTKEVFEPWSVGIRPSDIPMLPTTLLRTYKDAKLRARELHDFERLTIPQIADALMSEGHVNAEGRPVWYHRAVQDALREGL